jgi:hypothetical protein
MSETSHHIMLRTCNKKIQIEEGLTDKKHNF